MLNKYIDKLKENLVTEYKPFPTKDDRKVWENINEDVKKYVLDTANEFSDKGVTALTASMWLDYSRTGNRNNYQKLYSKRFIKLFSFTAAELIENKGKYIDKILDIVWAICEQSIWLYPAHNSIGGIKSHSNIMPDDDNQLIGILSSEVGSAVAFAYYFFKDDFDAIDPIINQRIKRELNNKIIKPYLDRIDYWWMGFTKVDDEQLNNWNPWIASNVLLVSLLAVDDKIKKVQTIKKVLRSLSEYINYQTNDGGCDEGPGYWSKAGASVFDCLAILEEATNGFINVWDEEKIINAGKYVYRANIYNRYFTNYADAASTLKPSIDVLYKYGQKINDKNLMAFSKYELDLLSLEDLFFSPYETQRKLNQILLFDTIKSHKKDFIPCKKTYLEDIQVAFLRTKKLYFTAKGGHNFENHNHNDVGSYMVYKNNTPFIIDMGSMVYTKKTFSKLRYEIMNTQSQYHNLPTINQVMQSNGFEYKASDVSYIENKDKTIFTLDIKEAYGKEANINKWKRTFEIIERSETIRIVDDYEFSEEQDFFSGIITCAKPTIKNNTIELINGDETLNIEINDGYDISIESIEYDDESLMKNWNELYRIIIKAEKNTIKGKIEYTIL